MPLEVGTRLGHYDVTALIGQGGMGEVYRARDTKLGRDVALKVLPDVFADDPERLARFQREARVLASLNHPNIASIYGLEESGDTRALVLELVEGPTLAERIAQGAIPIDEALPIARQIADALEAAHEAGVIHRDLKPANVKVKADGVVKVLDFGLAKALQGDVSGDPSQSPTLTAAATRMGVIMGTAAYMSPEQARGRPVDRRADIWAFGVLVYEMLTGKRAFEGEDISLTLAAVMKSELDWDTLPAGLSPALRTYLRRCLQKDPRQRVQAIGDVRLAMEGAFETATPGSREVAAAAPQPVGWRRALPWVAGVVVGGIITGVAVWTLKPQPSPRVTRSAVSVPPSAPVATDGNDPSLAISPDGSRIVYRTSTRDGQSQLYVRALDQLEGVALRGPVAPEVPFLSPDGGWVGFFSPTDTTLKKVSILGGPAVTVCELPVLYGASWGQDDTIIFATTDGLRRVSAGGGEAEVLTTREPASFHLWPDILPGGRAVLFAIWNSPAVSDQQIVVLDLESSEQKVLIQGGSYPRYSPSGHIVYAVEGALHAVAFDLEHLDVTGDPVPVLDNVFTTLGPSGAAQFSLSQDGTLVYVRGGEVGTAASTLVWVDREGMGTALPLPARQYQDPRLSPDGRRVAVGVVGSLWVFDVQSAAGLRLTNEAFVRTPIWTPDGERIIFSWDKEPPNALFWIPADGSGEAERLTTPDAGTADYPTSVSPDGQAVVFTRFLDTGDRELWQVPLDGERTPQPVVEGEFSRGNAALSPDGQWLAYRSNQSGVVEVYLQPYPGPGSTTPVSIGGGDSPVWSHDGRELFYRVGDRLMVVEVEPEPTLRVSPPEELWEEPYFDMAFGTGVRQYHVAPDGRFLMIRQGSAATDDTSAAPDLILVQNWFEELQRFVPTP